MPQGLLPPSRSGSAAPLASQLLTLTLFVTLAFTWIFVSFPGLDIAISRLFTDADGAFPMTRSAALQGLNDALKYGLTAWFFLAALLVPVGLRAGGRLRKLALSGRFLVLAGLIGPGLIVNGVLKSLVGRARPVNVTEFGGDHLFSPMLMVTDQCPANCSFSSGEVAMTATFVFTLLVLLWPVLCGRAKPLAALAGAGLICLSILLRVGLGRHFLSDALTSVAISALVTMAALKLVPLLQPKDGTGQEASPASGIRSRRAGTAFP